MKVGMYKIPDMSLQPKLVEAVKKIYEKFKSEEAPDQLTVAKLIGHKSVSGSFWNKMAYLRAYGLIEKRGIKVTDLGKRLTYGETDDIKNEALKEAILNIPLWKEFYSRWGVNLPTVDFWVDLRKITGLEAPEAQKAEKNVRNAYLRDIQYLKVEKEPEKEGIEVTTETKVDTSIAKTPMGLEELKFGENVRILLPKENIKEAWKKAKKMVDIYLGVEEEG